MEILILRAKIGSKFKCDLRKGSGNEDDETEKYRLSDSADEERVERLRKEREKRMAEIREKKRKRKPAEEISDGEVDSEGEQVMIYFS